MTHEPMDAQAFRVADLSQTTQTPFRIAPNSTDRGAIAARLDLLGLRKLSFSGEIAPLGSRDWRLTGQLGATVVQPCVATLDPVTTRIDTGVERHFVHDFVDPDLPETEMTEDDHVEPLGALIDPARVMEEALSLALPLYPRADGTKPVEIQVTEPGKAALTDETAKPFAGLAALKQKMDDASD